MYYVIDITIVILVVTLVHDIQILRRTVYTLVV